MYIFNLLVPDGGLPPRHLHHVDMRDIVKAHISALNSPPTSVVGRKRIIFSSPYGLDWNAAVGYIREKRPELKDRLIKQTLPVVNPDRIPIDLARIEQVLGMKREDFHTLETVLIFHSYATI